MKKNLFIVNFVIILIITLLQSIKLCAQETADNKFSLNLNVLERGEYVYGVFREEDATIEGMSHFVLGRVSDGQRLHWAYLMLSVNPDIFSTTWNDKK